MYCTLNSNQQYFFVAPITLYLTNSTKSVPVPVTFKSERINHKRLKNPH